MGWRIWGTGYEFGFNISYYNVDSGCEVSPRWRQVHCGWIHVSASNRSSLRQTKSAGRARIVNRISIGSRKGMIRSSGGAQACQDNNSQQPIGTSEAGTSGQVSQARIRFSRMSLSEDQLYGRYLNLSWKPWDFNSRCLNSGKRRWEIWAQKRPDPPIRTYSKPNPPIILEADTGWTNGSWSCDRGFSLDSDPVIIIVSRKGVPS
jgi:hypothetical protein